MTGRSDLPRSAIYTGHVRHRRTDPISNRFRYPFYMLLLELEELSHWSERLRLFGYNRPATTTLRDRDHLGQGMGSIREKLFRWLQQQKIEPPSGPIFLLTQLRVFGYVFNPLSLYYCYSDARDLLFIVAEVHNTFGDTHLYLLRQEPEKRPPNPNWMRAEAKKCFHVSPFIAMDARYVFHISNPLRTAHVQIEEFRNGERFLDATLTLRSRELTDRNLLGTLLSHPLMPLQTIVLIHWQALKLWRKKAPFVKYTPPPSGLNHS